MRKSFRKNIHIKFVNIIMHFGIIVCVSYSGVFGAQELPQGMLPYGIPRTALERVNHDMNDFPGSGEANLIKQKYGEIFNHIKNVPETTGVQALLDLIHDARRSASNVEGRAINWECTKQICLGHTLEEKHDSDDKAKSEGQKHHKEYANKPDIDSSSLQLYEVRQHGSKTDVAFLSAMAGSSAAVTAGSVALFFMPPFGTGIALANVGVSSFGLGTTIYGAHKTKKVYDNIWYNMSLYYKHKESHLQSCDDKKTETFSKSTKELLRAINSLGILVRIFKIESEIKRLDQENPALRTELQTLRLQLNTLS
jgi:hypothetical protein